MKRALVCLCLAACGGDEIVLTPQSVASQQQAETCHVKPHDDVCDRPLDGVTSNATELRQLLQALAVLDGNVTDADASLFRACDAIVLWNWGRDPDDGIRVSTSKRCEEAARTLNGIGLSISRDPSTDCVAENIPACSTLRAVTRCRSHIQVRRDGLRDPQLEAMIAPLFDVKDDLEEIADRANALTALLPAANGVAPGCAPEISKTASDVTQGITGVVDAAAKIAPAIER